MEAEMSKKEQAQPKVSSTTHQSSRQVVVTPMTFRRGNHVIVRGDYKPLARNFTPSVKGSK
jgi:hypothetical protein